jgi:hypothetical protein
MISREEKANMKSKINCLRDTEEVFKYKYFKIDGDIVVGVEAAISLLLKNIEMMNARFVAIEKHLGIESVARDSNDKYYTKEVKK